jgi:sulfate-transporting ATPase
MADEKIIFSMVGVSKTFTNQKKVLNNIYLSFFYGAKIGIIGLNGSGKSTLMKIIAGIDKNFQGEVVFSPGYTVGYLEQEPKLDDAKTVREVVEEGCASTVALLKEYEEINQKLCEPMDDEEMARLIERQGELYEQIDHVNGWELDSVLERAMDALRCPDPDQSVKVLSGGERRRTEIARAVAINPAFILLDEPFAGVDPIAVEDIQSIVATLKHKNIGVIITDHNVDETLAITDRTYLLYEGKILKTGTAEELAADPMVRKVYLGQHFELKKSHQLTQEMKNRKGQEVNE